EGALGIEAQVPRRADHHAGQWFATVAAIVRPMRTKVNPVECDTICRQERGKPRMDFCQLRKGNLAARDAGLIGHDREAKTLIAQPPQCRADPPIELEQVWIGDVVALDIESAISIEQNEATGSHGASSYTRSRRAAKNASIPPRAARWNGKVRKSPSRSIKSAVSPNSSARRGTRRSGAPPASAAATRPGPSVGCNEHTA